MGVAWSERSRVNYAVGTRPRLGDVTHSAHTLTHSHTPPRYDKLSQQSLLHPQTPHSPGLERTCSPEQLEETFSIVSAEFGQSGAAAAPPVTEHVWGRPRCAWPCGRSAGWAHRPPCCGRVVRSGSRLCSCAGPRHSTPATCAAGGEGEEQIPLTSEHLNDPRLLRNC